jgi:hypothetical protein
MYTLQKENMVIFEKWSPLCLKYLTLWEIPITGGSNRNKKNKGIQRGFRLK